MTPTLTRSWRLARVATAALALTTAALTVSGSASGTGAQSSSATAAATTTQPCLAAAPDHRVRAGSAANGVDPNTVSLAKSQHLQSRLAARAQQRQASSQKALKKATIDVYVHVITTDDGKGGVSKSRVKKQIDVLNKAYAGKSSKSSKKTPFTFKLKGIDRTANSQWSSWTTPDDETVGDDVAPKKALHQGGFDDLNIYTASVQGGVLGYATFPGESTLLRDGVVLLNESLPKGKAKGYDKGDTATHEVGHWLGLYHTFQGGCLEPGGDYVDDTPAQADGNNVFSCSSKLDTCASKGKDPVHNFMSYGDDKCLDRFTKGQVKRMTAAWQAFRAPGAGA